eukprot:12912073-Prorocentrum_lima.AAC.1
MKIRIRTQTPSHEEKATCTKTRSTSRGVGGATNSIQSRAIEPIGVSELGNAVYYGSMLDNSEVPTLLGL